jgi:hypothetical protein
MCFAVRTLATERQLRRIGAVTLAAALALSVAPTTALGKRDIRTVDRSARISQEIGRVDLVRSDRGHQRLKFTVDFPRVGLRPGTARIRVIVFKNEARRGIVETFEKPIPTAWRKRVSGSMRIPSRSEAPSLKAITVSVFHRRPLTKNRSHTMTAGDIGSELVRGFRDRPSGATTRDSDYTATNYEIANNSDETVWLTAAPVTCMYDNGNGSGGTESFVSNFNNVKLSPGASITSTIQSNDGGGANDPYSPTSSGGGEHLLINPDYANNLYSPNVRGFMFTAINKYTSTVADPQTFKEVQENILPAQNSSCGSEGRFAIGVDAYTPSSSGGPQPLGPHTASLMILKDKNDVGIEAPLFYADDYTANAAPYYPGFPTGESWLIMTVANANEAEISSTGQSQTPCDGGTDWMSCQFPPGSSKEQTPLYNVAFPGSHDSVTGSLMSNDEWILKTGGGDPCSSYNAAFDISPGDVYNLGATQNYIIRDQLDAGIRYLDLRNAFTNYPGSTNSGSYSDQNPAWRPLHTMFAQSTTQTEAQAIASWAAGHPDEIVIADYNHVCPEAATAAAGENGQGSYVTNGFLDALTQRDPVTNVSICDVSYITTGSATDIPLTTIQQMRAQNRNVLVLLDPGPASANNNFYDPAVIETCGFNPLWDQTERNGAGVPGNAPINHLWPDEPGPIGLTAGCNYSEVGQNIPSADNIQSYPLNSASPGIGTAATLDTFRGASPIPLTQAQTQFTVDQSDEEVDEIAGCGTLLDFESEYIQNYRDLVINGTGPQSGSLWPSGKNWADYLNIVIGDGVNQAYISTVASLNGSSSRNCWESGGRWRSCAKGG